MSCALRQLKRVMYWQTYPIHTQEHIKKKLIIAIDQYAYVVPYVEDEEKIFLKTMYASHKETKKYLSGK